SSDCLGDTAFDVTPKALVRWRIEPLDGTKRTLDDRLRLSAPKASRCLAITALRALPPGSRLRKPALTRAARAGSAAAGRDLEDGRIIRQHAVSTEYEALELLAPPNVPH